MESKVNKFSNKSKNKNGSKDNKSYDIRESKYTNKKMSQSKIGRLIEQRFNDAPSAFEGARINSLEEEYFNYYVTAMEVINGKKPDIRIINDCYVIKNFLIKKELTFKRILSHFKVKSTKIDYQCKSYSEYDITDDNWKYYLPSFYFEEGNDEELFYKRVKREGGLSVTAQMSTCLFALLTSFKKFGYRSKCISYLSYYLSDFDFEVYISNDSSMTSWKDSLGFLRVHMLIHSAMLELQLLRNGSEQAQKAFYSVVKFIFNLSPHFACNVISDTMSCLQHHMSHLAEPFQIPIVRGDLVSVGESWQDNITKLLLSDWYDTVYSEMDDICEKYNMPMPIKLYEYIKQISYKRPTDVIHDIQLISGLQYSSGFTKTELKESALRQVNGANHRKHGLSSKYKEYINNIKGEGAYDEEAKAQAILDLSSDKCVDVPQESKDEYLESKRYLDDYVPRVLPDDVVFSSYTKLYYHINNATKDIIADVLKRENELWNRTKLRKNIFKRLTSRGAGNIRIKFKLMGQDVIATTKNLVGPWILGDIDEKMAYNKLRPTTCGERWVPGGKKARLIFNDLMERFYFTFSIRDIFDAVMDEVQVYKKPTGNPYVDFFKVIESSTQPFWVAFCNDFSMFDGCMKQVIRDAFNDALNEITVTFYEDENGSITIGEIMTGVNERYRQPALVKCLEGLILMFLDMMQSGEGMTSECDSVVNKGIQDYVIEEVNKVVSKDFIFKPKDDFMHIQGDDSFFAWLLGTANSISRHEYEFTVDQISKFNIVNKLMIELYNSVSYFPNAKGGVFLNASTYLKRRFVYGFNVYNQRIQLFNDERQTNFDVYELIATYLSKFRLFSERGVDQDISYDVMMNIVLIRGVVRFDYEQYQDNSIGRVRRLGAKRFFVIPKFIIYHTPLSLGGTGINPDYRFLFLPNSDINIIRKSMTEQAGQYSLYSMYRILGAKLELMRNNRIVRMLAKEYATGNVVIDDVKGTDFKIDTNITMFKESLNKDVLQESIKSRDDLFNITNGHVVVPENFCYFNTLQRFATNAFKANQTAKSRLKTYRDTVVYDWLSKHVNPLKIQVTYRLLECVKVSNGSIIYYDNIPSIIDGSNPMLSSLYKIFGASSGDSLKDFSISNLNNILRSAGLPRDIDASELIDFLTNPMLLSSISLMSMALRTIGCEGTYAELVVNEILRNPLLYILVKTRTDGGFSVVNDSMVFINLAPKVVMDKAIAGDILEVQAVQLLVQQLILMHIIDTNDPIHKCYVQPIIEIDIAKMNRVLSRVRL